MFLRDCEPSLLDERLKLATFMFSQSQISSFSWPSKHVFCHLALCSKKNIIIVFITYINQLNLSICFCMPALLGSWWQLQYGNSGC